MCGTKKKNVRTAVAVEFTRSLRSSVKVNKTEHFKNNSVEATRRSPEDEDYSGLDPQADAYLSECSESDEEYVPPTKKVGSRQTRGSSWSVDSSLMTRSEENIPLKLKADTETKVQSAIKNTKKDSEKECDSEIPDHLSQESKAALKELVLENSRDSSQKRQIMIRCHQNDCRRAYPSWSLLARHIKYFHYDGSLPHKQDTWQKLSMLADNGKLYESTHIHRCKHENCEIAFTTEDSLKKHTLAHDLGLTLMCSFPDCTKAFKVISSLRVHHKTHLRHERPLFICDVDSCKESFAHKREFVKHKKKHQAGAARQHKCHFEGCGETFTKKEKLEIHLCTHSPERRLFCEKCGQAFSCRRYLDVHHKIHIKNEVHASQPPSRSIACEQDGCTKMFTTRENMKSHVLNQHKGRKPRSVPGVFYPCSVPGCGKKFSFRSTLYRHTKLVHRGGDYKLGRRVVQYPCTYDESCGKVFNRKNLLEEHLVMDHGKSDARRLLPLRSKELDYTERVCAHCGMVLTAVLMPRHQRVYHSGDTGRDLSENKSFPCHLEGCNEILNTQEDRKEHVKVHLSSPPFSCKVGECREVFYLEKNLDNHLWNHSRKPSTCDFEECGQTFEDQIELAKHSKVHYNGKMKCPWPDCDNWLTETGQLRPHFIAHSRMLRASMDSDYVCEVCQLAFSSRWGLMIHKRIHGEEAAALAKPTLPHLAKFSCEEPGCPATFCDQTGFFDHFLYHHTKKPCTCDFEGCGQSFDNLISLSRHSKMHFSDGKYRCAWPGCGKFFASPFIVKRHIYRHITAGSRRTTSAFKTGSTTGDDVHPGDENAGLVEKAGWPLSCQHCFMVFRLQANLASHMETHNEKPDYVCPTCGKKGRHSHAKPLSAGNKPRKPLACDQCGPSYSTLSGLKFHQLQKHKIGKWPFKCSYCGKGFVSSREMQRHMPSHTKEKPFVCDICGASFASHTGHRAHMRKHTGQKFVCEVEGCGKVYTTPISLRGHMAKHAGFSKICEHCGKVYKNPYGHKCKAAKDGKKKLLSDSKLGQGLSATGQQQQPVPSVSSFHLLQPPQHQYSIQHHPHHHHHQQQQQQQQQQPQQLVHHHRVLQMTQQQQQQQQNLHYVIPSGASVPETGTNLSSSLMQGLASPQAPILPLSSSSSSSSTAVQQPHMILMAPHMLQSTTIHNSGGNNSLAIMAIQQGNSHHNSQNYQPGVLIPQQLQSQQQILSRHVQPLPPSLPPPLPSSTSSSSLSFSHINLLQQNLPPTHSSSLLQQQQHPPQHNRDNSVATSNMVVPQGVILQQTERVNSAVPPSNSALQQEDYTYNNYVVFWDGQT